MAPKIKVAKLKTESDEKGSGSIRKIERDNANMSNKIKKERPESSRRRRETAPKWRPEKERRWGTRKGNQEKTRKKDCTKLTQVNK